jgi:dTDP-4-amino-4,6-dideoxygalactose transaminase
MANLNAAVACSLMQTLSENIAARRACVRGYQVFLGDVAGLQLIPHRPGSACLTQVVRVLPKRNGRDLASEVIKALGHAGFEIQGSYVPIHLLGNFDECIWHRLPHTERVWADLIELPCEPGVRFDDIERIATIVKETVTS